MLDEQLLDVLGQEPHDGLLADRVTIRAMCRSDLPALRALSPAEVKHPAQFFAYSTLVAEVDGEIAGYTQYALTPDGILHSYAIRIGAQWKGMGIGSQLMEAKIAIAKAAGGRMHFYPVAPEGEVALKKILMRLGMHLCIKQPDAWVYTGSLVDEEGV